MAWPYGSATATIANGASLSGAVDLGGKLLCAILLPSGWSAADLTFQASFDNSTFVNVYNDDDTEYTVQAAADRYVLVDPSKFAATQYIKIRSGTSGASINQSGGDVLTLALADRV